MKTSGWIAFIWIVVLACSDTTPPTTVAAPTTTIAAPPTTESVTTTSASLQPAPWASSPPLAAADVPVLVAEWGQAENQATCAALSPSGGVSGATPRPASFAGGWAVAWDAPDGPGMAADGTFCEDCGRSAVGVAGAGVSVIESDVRVWPSVIEYADGSVVGYGIEGSVAGTVDDALTTSGDSATQLAYLSIPGQACLYNVWSRRSEAELLDVIGRLRFVEGLGAPSG